MKNIAVFGGAFDPPTHAHEAIIKACLSRVDIDEVWVMPSGCRTDKPGLLHDAVRIEMLNVMLAGSFLKDQRLKLCDIELTLAQPTNTQQTLAALREQYPRYRFWFVFGADSYHTMPTWEDGEQLQSTLDMLIVGRPGFRLPETPNTRVLRAGTKLSDVSSSHVRQLLNSGLPADTFLSPPVIAFIQEHKLYGVV